MLLRFHRFVTYPYQLTYRSAKFGPHIELADIHILFACLFFFFRPFTIFLFTRRILLVFAQLRGVNE